MKLYGLGPTRSIRALWVLNELKIPFEFVSVNLPEAEHQHPEFLRLNPAGKVPVLVDDDAVITESVAIVLYLAEKYPSNGLLPVDIKARAQVYRWMMFAVTELEPPLWRIARHTMVYPEDSRLPAEIALARREFVEMVTVLERHMQGRQFIVGNSITLADCVTAYLIDWANEDGLLEDQPQLLAYLQRMYARPAAPPRIAAAFAELQSGDNQHN
ncbi:glutathione S-transferase family protein [Halomonas huangheensis]|uniref:Glutathione S-transferase n=1 Tax=Halomonas huangheensis TaxID=1178482 RepID=W1NCD5_9GAMM|nr:glutathione S-transferase family protein [Halomonas huangheensis]ALM52930.1 glutathione S-transferase [Halomonas huangheensis]ERL53148.1 hypothetical protein BJB45_17890 [Halomonas huangheensis]